MAPSGFRGYNARVRNAAALAVALGIVIAPTAAAAPRPHVERARAGLVEVTFSYAYDAAKFGFSRQRLVIRRAGVTRFAAALRRPPSPGGRAQPANYFDHRRSVSVRDLDRDGAPEVVLDLYWGGAHCCWYTQIYRYVSAAGTYRPLVHVWGNLPYRLEGLDRVGTPELVAHDNRFSYAFSSFADSRWPIRILRYGAGTLTFVTRSYARQIGHDATALWKESMSPAGKRDNYGRLAAWAADECMLGHSGAAFDTLEQLRRSGRLHGQPKPAAYLKHLRRFLRRTGYL